MDYRSYLALAIPFIISTVTQPILGAVDTGVIGRLDDASYIGGVAIGTVIFNTLYWVFGFLRVSTSGFSSQSLGSGKQEDRYHAYLRPASMAMIIGLFFIIFQNGIWSVAMHFYAPEQNIGMYAATYYRVLIWGAPLVLLGYVNLGWLMGRKFVRETLFLQISMNALNILLDILFVLYLDKGVEGVAVATLISQIYGFLIGTGLVVFKLKISDMLYHLRSSYHLDAFKRIIGVNTDLMIRTICLLAMINMFVAKGTEMGKDILAANAILFQIQYIMSYLFDGLANASSVFTGESVGEINSDKYKQIFKISTVCTTGMALILSVGLWMLGTHSISLFTTLDSVIEVASLYLNWVIVFPFAVGMGLVYYGIFSGATYTAPIRNSMIIALALYTIIYVMAIPHLGNHGLWLAFTVFSLCRSVVLYLYRNNLFENVFIRKRKGGMLGASTQ